jgi:hypothetical protein
MSSERAVAESLRMHEITVLEKGILYITYIKSSGSKWDIYISIDSSATKNCVGRPGYLHLHEL